MDARWRYGIMGMADKVSGKDSGGRAWWRICVATWMDTVVDEKQDVNIRYVGWRRWKNGLEEWQWNGQISTGNNYQPEGVSLP